MRAKKKKVISFHRPSELFTWMSKIYIRNIFKQRKVNT